MLPGTGAGDKSSSRSALARRTPSLGGAPDGLARARRRRAQTEGCTSGGTGPEKVPHMQAARCFSSAPVKRALPVTAWQVARRGHQSLVTALGTPGAHVTTVTALPFQARVGPSLESAPLPPSQAACCCRRHGVQVQAAPQAAHVRLVQLQHKPIVRLQQVYECVP